MTRHDYAGLEPKTRAFSETLNGNSGPQLSELLVQEARTIFGGGCHASRQPARRSKGKTNGRLRAGADTSIAEQYQRNARSRIIRHA